MTTTEDGNTELIAKAKQTILDKFRTAILDNQDYLSGTDFSALLRAVEEGDDDDFINILHNILSEEDSETIEEMLRRVISDELEGKEEEQTIINPLWKGLVAIGIAIVVAAALFAPIDEALKRGITMGGALLASWLIWCWRFLPTV